MPDVPVEVQPRQPAEAASCHHRSAEFQPFSKKMHRFISDASTLSLSYFQAPGGARKYQFERI
jgi:hypothetical protein